MATTTILADTAAIESLLRNPATSELLAQHDLAPHTDGIEWAAELYQLIPLAAYSTPWIVRAIEDSEPEDTGYTSIREAEAALEQTIEDVRGNFHETYGGYYGPCPECGHDDCECD